MTRRKEIAKQKYIEKAIEEEIMHRSVASRFSTPLYPFDLESASQRTVKTS